METDILNSHTFSLFYFLLFLQLAYVCTSVGIDYRASHTADLLVPLPVILATTHVEHYTCGTLHKLPLLSQVGYIYRCLNSGTAGLA